MLERKCDFPPVVKSVGEGKVTCPDQFFNGYKEHGKCTRCPKALNINKDFFVRERLSPGEREAAEILRDHFRSNTRSFFGQKK